MFSNNNAGTIETRDIVENLGLRHHISPQAHSCVIGLLENNPKKLLGSPKSPHMIQYMIIHFLKLVVELIGKKSMKVYLNLFMKNEWLIIIKRGQTLD